MSGSSISGVGVGECAPAPAGNDPLMPASGFIHDLRDGLLHLPNALFDDLLDVTHGLIRLALGAQSVVAGQRPRGFLDATLHYLCCALHDALPFIIAY